MNQIKIGSFIKELRKEKLFDMKTQNLYKESFWYRNTYESLGSFWLIKSLEKLKVEKGYIFINLSANAGYYEKEVYDKHFNLYNPTYYIGDIEASNLKDKKIDSFKQFNYIEGDNNAVTMDVSIIPNKADIILDCKGALWYTIGNKNELIQLLENYSKLLDDSGVLLIDYYKTNYLKYFLQSLKWHLKRYNYKQTIVDCFGELSTYSYLVDLYGKKMINRLLIPLDIKEEKEKLPLSKIMDSAYISKENLDILIRVTKNTSKWKFVFAKLKRNIKRVVFSIIYILLLCTILFISFFVFLTLERVISIFCLTIITERRVLNNALSC